MRRKAEKNEEAAAAATTTAFIKVDKSVPVSSLFRLMFNVCSANIIEVAILLICHHHRHGQWTEYDSQNVMSRGFLNFPSHPHRHSKGD